jgi:hypothetical protein
MDKLVGEFLEKLSPDEHTLYLLEVLKVDTEQEGPVTKAQKRKILEKFGFKNISKGN